MSPPELQVLPDPGAVAERGATLLAAWLRDAIDRWGDALLAVSGGRSPWAMFELLVRDTTVDWSKVHLVQVDERVLPDGHEDRNWTHIAARFVDSGVIAPARAHPMPVTATDLNAAADTYAALINTLCPEGVIDALHLGLGDDGHTASLAPGDDVCMVVDRDVAVTTRPYNGTRRMTLTRRCLDRAAHGLFQVCGESKRLATEQFMNGDASIPAVLLDNPNLVVLADEAAGGA